MGWSVLSIFMIFFFINTASADMDAATRRDFIAACMFSGGFSVQGREPIVSDDKGKVDIQRTVNSWIDSFNKPEDKLRAGELIRSCLQPILGVYDRMGARVVPRDSDYVELVTEVMPVEYLKGLICRNKAVRLKFTISYVIRNRSHDIDKSAKDLIDDFVYSFGGLLFGDGSDELFVKEIMETNPDSINCNSERICKIGGVVPAEIKTDMIKFFDTPMRKVRILSGQCGGKIGFVNERFIDF